MKYAWAAALLGILSVAAALRLPHLADRPMHADEAVLADKFGTLLETGVYDYDPRDYHGPVLLYATLVPSWLRGIRTYVDLDEQALRIVPVFFGLLLVAMPLLLAWGVGRAEALAAAGLTAVSPAIVYYSRYYIPEMLLVCFLLGVIAFGYLYARTGRARWAILAGSCLGLAFAAKETAALAVLAMAAALALTTRKLGDYRVLALGVGAALVVFVLAITSFFREPGAAVEYIRSFAGYLGRGFGRGPHVHPWHYYAGLMLRSEALVVVLAAVGAAVALKRRDARLLRFLLWYTAVLLVLYSVIPYKTPWCVLSPLSGMLLLAGAGMVALFRWRKVVFAVVAAAGGRA
ncbi:MAG TPA: TIGR03663 family protein, partial [Bryobacteraceae bacterium]|nr:TIGR03663 family protein [Bryobacteraceae bacterium]